MRMKSIEEEFRDNFSFLFILKSLPEPLFQSRVQEYVLPLMLQFLHL